MNAATLSAVLAPGVTMGQAVDFLKSQPLPVGTTVDWLSDSRQYVTEGNRLTVSFGFALIVIFLVLAAQFESFRDPLVILVTVPLAVRSEEHTSELQSLMRISYAVFCLKKKKKIQNTNNISSQSYNTSHIIHNNNTCTLHL